jgi:hypothetical protein
MKLLVALALAAASCATPDVYHPPDASSAGMDGAESLVPLLDGAADAPAMSHDGSVLELDAPAGVDGPSADLGVDQGTRDMPADGQGAADAAVTDASRPDAPPADCLKCSDGTCARTAWNFDDGALGGTKAYGERLLSPAVALSPPYQGRQSLAVVESFKFGDLSGSSGGLTFPVCPSGATASVRNKKFSIRVFVESASGTPAAASVFYLYLFSEQMIAPFVETTYPDGSWVLLEGRVPDVEDGRMGELYVVVAVKSNPDWEGRAWVDDVRIE